MIYTFVTILAGVWVLLWLSGIAVMIWEWTEMTPVQRMRATINVNPVGIASFLAAVSWLIAVLVS